MTELAATLRAIPLNSYVLLCTVLFCIGAMGVMMRRNVIVIFMCVELMLNSANLLFAAFSAYRGDAQGQIFVFFTMVVAAAEVAIGLAILVMIHRNLKTTDIKNLGNIRW